MGARARPSPDLLAPALASAVLLAAAVPEGGPFGFLPHLLRWPLIGAAIAVLWRPRLVALKLPAWFPAAAEGAGLALVFGSFCLLKLVGLHGSDTDDNIYFYMAQRLAEGAVPYRDFFFAHPPIHLVVPALIFKIAGFSLPVAKAIPVLAQAGAALCIYLAVRPASKGVAFTVLLLHLTAYEVLMGSTDMDGENIMTAFLAASLLFSVRQRPVIAGILGGLSLGTGLYSLAGIVALLLAHAGFSRRSLARYSAGLAGCLAAWMGVFGAVGGAGFVDGVFRYHFAKAASGDHISIFASPNPITIVSAYLHDLRVFLTSRVFGKSVVYHAPLYVAAAMGIGLAIRATLARSSGTDFVKRGWRRVHASMLSGTAEGLALLGGAAAVLFLLQWAALNEVYDFYMVPQLAVMAVPAGWALVAIAKRAGEAPNVKALAVPGALCAGFFLHVPLTHAVHRGLWPEEMRDAGKVVNYTWRDPVVLAGPAQLTRALFFKDHRVKGTPNPPYRHYLWNKSLQFSVAQQIADYVRANSREDETLTGASTPTPLVALLAGRRIAGDEADTNNKRFRSGMLSDEAFWNEVCADRVRFVLAAPQSRFTEGFMEKNPTALQYFERDQVFVDPALRHFRGEKFVLFKRREGVTAPQGRVCDYLP